MDSSIILMEDAEFLFRKIILIQHGVEFKTYDFLPLKHLRTTAELKSEKRG